MTAELTEKKRIIFREPWLYALPAFRVFGNLYFVGNKNGASWILKTEEGPILFDTNWPSTAHLLVDSMWSMGIDPKDLIAIFHTHGHYDHFGATEYLRQISGAKTYLGKGDCDMFRERPELALCDHCHAHMQYVDIFKPDVEVKDGDIFTFGSTTIRAASCPGHTDGSTSYFFPVTDGENTYTAGLHGGAGVNTLQPSFREKYGVDYRRTYLDSIDKMWNEKVDIFLGNHTNQNNLEEKYSRLGNGANPFIDSTEWHSFLERIRSRCLALMD